MMQALREKTPEWECSSNAGLDACALLAALPVATAVFDARCKLVRSNDHFARMLDLPAEDLAEGTSFAELVNACRARKAPADAESVGLWQFDGAIPSRHRSFERAMPRGRHAQVHVHPLPDGGMLLAALDISQEREETLRQRVLEDIGHELRTPLNAIAGMLQLAGTTPLTPAQAGYLARAEDAVQEMLQVIQPRSGEPCAATVAGMGADPEAPTSLMGLPAQGPGDHDAPAAPARRRTLADLGPRPLAGMKILVAEDNVANQVVARELLMGQGARVEIAVDGLDTLACLVAGGEFDAILMDWHMPNMDGLEAAREIRLMVGSEHTPIIALTANSTPSDRQACLDAGMNAHLAKPVNVESLVLCLLEHARNAPLHVLDRSLPIPGQAGAGRPAAPPCVNREEALQRLGGSTALYDQITDLFRREAPVLLREIADAARGGQRPLARRIAHTLKSTAASLGATRLAEAAQMAEGQFQADADDRDAAGLERLESCVREVLAYLAPPWNQPQAA